MKTLIIAGLMLLASSAAYADQDNKEVQVKPEVKQEQVCTGELSKAELEKRGCCSHHQGVCGCSSGTVTCCDGTDSPTCTCLKDGPVQN